MTWDNADEAIKLSHKTKPYYLKVGKIIQGGKKPPCIKNFLIQVKIAGHQHSCGRKGNMHCREQR